MNIVPSSHTFILAFLVLCSFGGAFLADARLFFWLEHGLLSAERADLVERQNKIEDQIISLSADAALVEKEEARRISLATAKLAALNARISQEIEEIEPRIGRAESELFNKMLIVRAVSLGALGGLASMLAALVQRNEIGRSWASADYRRTYAVMATGSIVSIVVLGLFLTREISVFGTSSEHGPERPEFWRVTIVCLVSGAFANRLYQAASQRLDQMVGRERPDA